MEDEEALTNRKFMYASENYRFEWKKLNEANGRAEGKILQYGRIFSEGATLAALKDYRAARKDIETTPSINEDLEARENVLTEAIAIKHNFLKK